MAVNSSTDICNLALIRLGEKRVTNIVTDSTERAIQCNLIYEQTRDELLRDYDWNFAIVRVQLAQLSEDPVGQYDYAYQLPVSPFCLRILNIITDQEAEGIENIQSHINQPDYRIERRKLLTNESTVSIRYMAREQDISLYDPLFIDAFSLRLATKLALSITQSTQLANAVFGEFLVVRNRAMAADGKEETRNPDPSSNKWVDAGRFGFGPRDSNIILKE